MYDWKTRLSTLVIKIKCIHSNDEPFNRSLNKIELHTVEIFKNEVFNTHDDYYKTVVLTTNPLNIEVCKYDSIKKYIN